MLNLPLDINIVILSYLSYNNLQFLANKTLISKNLMKFVLIHKYGSNRKDFLEGITNNFYSECFKCGLNLGAMYNIIICYKCNLFADGYHQYPLICHNCCKKKLKRGEMKYTFCDICNHSVTHLGITPFS